MRNWLIWLTFLFLMVFSGCNGVDNQKPFNKVEGVIVEIMYSVTETNEYVIRDLEGKNVTLKTNSKILPTIMHIGDNVEIYYNNEFEPKKVTVKQNNM